MGSFLLNSHYKFYKELSCQEGFEDLDSLFASSEFNSGLFVVACVKSSLLRLTSNVLAEPCICCPLEHSQRIYMLLRTFRDYHRLLIAE